MGWEKTTPLNCGQTLPSKLSCMGWRRGGGAGRRSSDRARDSPKNRTVSQTRPRIGQYPKISSPLGRRNTAGYHQRAAVGVQAEMGRCHEICSVLPPSRHPPSTPSLPIALPLLRVQSFILSFLLASLPSLPCVCFLLLPRRHDTFQRWASLPASLLTLSLPPALMEEARDTSHGLISLLTCSLTGWLWERFLNLHCI